jgi:hypothetical protein
VDAEKVEMSDLPAHQAARRGIVQAATARLPRITTLWRAAAHDVPYFGRGSHWTTSEHRVIYRAEVYLTDVFEMPAGIPHDSHEVAKCVASAWPEGYRWLAFYQAGEWDTRLAKHYVYLGNDLITAALAGRSG